MQKKYNYISKRHYDHDKKTLKIIHSFKILNIIILIIVDFY